MGTQGKNKLGPSSVRKMSANPSVSRSAEGKGEKRPSSQETGRKERRPKSKKQVKKPQSSSEGKRHSAAE